VQHVAEELHDRRALERRHRIEGRIADAAARDAAAHARDLEAIARDQRAELIDRELAPSEARVHAAADRAHAARDRERAALDRLQARADLDLLLAQLAIAETDALTGARTRTAGLVALEHEIARARRGSGLLVVAFVDVVGLKAINDARGHGAGDALLQRVVHAIGSRLRSYDLIIRIGGDEFLCVLSGATITHARARLSSVQALLATGPDPSGIRVGFGALGEHDGAAELIRRADADLGGRS
jgi:diguanylate cyclase (GGDEF)-like protein